MPVWNSLVVGDNLDVLPALAAAGERYDVVYLDPPYGTGSAFAYADPSAGGHEAWLAAVRPRLEAVREVTATTGAVWISIDDRELAHLRLACDEVFGERNRLAQVVVQLNAKGRQLGRWLATEHEYLLVYARDERRCTLDPTTTDSVRPSDFGLRTADGRAYRHLPLRNTNKRFTPATAPTMRFPLYGDPASGRVAAAPFAGAEEVWPVFGDGAPAVWRWSAPLVAERTDDLVCRVVRGPAGDRVDVSQRDWLTPDRRKKLRTIWPAEEVGSTDTAVAELKALVGGVFESPKPTGLLRRILATAPPEARVLDPYAGSGTTGHAVALANLADGGSRRCTSIEVPAPVRPGSFAATAGLATTADITRARLAAVAAGLGGGLEVRGTSDAT